MLMSFSTSKRACLDVVQRAIDDAIGPNDVLEAGTGVGHTALVTAQMLRPDDTFHAVDINERNITDLRERLVANPSVRCTVGNLVASDLRRLQPFPVGSLHMVCSDTVIALLGTDIDVALEAIGLCSASTSHLTLGSDGHGIFCSKRFWPLVRCVQRRI